MTKSEIQSGIQNTARQAWYDAGMRGLAAMGTGTGKSKLAIDVITDFSKKRKSKLRALIAVPTVKLRDKNWPKEFKKWKKQRYLVRGNVEIVCYASLNNYKREDYDLVILDEAHRLTETKLEFFETGKDVPMIALSATPPNTSSERGQQKAALLENLGLKTVFTYTLDQGIADGISSDYIIYMVPTSLGTKKKYIAAGSKAKPFKSTESSNYRYLQKMMAIGYAQDKMGMIDFLRNKRMHMIYSLHSKYSMAYRILKRLPDTLRLLVFGGSIDLIDQLMGKDRVYHHKSDDKALDAFMAGKLDRLGAVNALNEGMDIDNVDGAVIIQINSNDRDLVQRIGRAVRFRPNHTARIFVIYAKGTQDEVWVKKAIVNLDKSKIRYLAEESI